MSNGTTRRSFSKFIRRPEDNPLALQGRDLEILKLIYDYRFIPSHHITNLIAGSERKILGRLQKLFHQGYLERLADRRIRTRAGSEKMVYAITRKAGDLLAGEGDLDISKIDWDLKNRTVTERHIKHTLMIAKFRTILTIAAESQAGVEIEQWKENRGSGKSLNPELSDTVKLEIKEGKEIRLRIVPDAFFSLRERDSEMFFFLEADRGTMPTERFWKKLTAYRAWWMQGGSKKKLGAANFRVLTITPSNKRRDNLREVAKRVKPAGMFWFAAEKNYSVNNPGAIFDAIWINAKDDKTHSLLE
ncbi:MAG: replication-relaxation family protein [Planctomycetes bacterium]|nr:replication-relaxation family protein [Planctomycetota bacterium]